MSDIAPLDGSPMMFSINNTGVVELDDVQPALGVCQIAFAPAPPVESRGVGCDHAQGIGTFLRFIHWRSDRIEPDHGYNISLQDAIKGTISYADISIVVDYRPWFLPWHRHASFRFTTKLGADGKNYWFARSA